MRFNFLFYLLLHVLFFGGFCDAQKMDRIWIFGDSTGIDFNDLDNPIAIPSNSSYTSENNASICDNNGNILFYLGGAASSSGNAWYQRMKVFNKEGYLMDNGDSLNSSYTVTNGLMIIPYPNDSNKYYLFHIKNYIGGLFYSVIDVSFNNELGKVISKNIHIEFEDSLTEKLAAVKHGNGKDWWLICHQFGNSRFYKFLITENGISDPISQDIGSCHCNDVQFQGENCFSPDGSKYMCVADSIVDIFNFDRCSGELSLIGQFGDSLNPGNSHIYGCSFSPSGNLFYVSAPTYSGYESINKLFQLNLKDENILDSKYLVYSGPLNNEYSLIEQHQLGPDGKIYICNQLSLPYSPLYLDSTNTKLSVIEDPDALGAMCNFNPYSFYLNGRQTGGGLPNMPNYNLGALEKSACDTLGVYIQEPNIAFSFSLSPNPASSYFTLTSTTDLNTISIIDAFGRIVKEVNNLSTNHITIAVNDLSEGIYLVILLHRDQYFLQKLIVSK